MATKQAQSASTCASYFSAMDACADNHGDLSPQICRLSFGAKECPFYKKKGKNHHISQNQLNNLTNF